MEKNTHSVLHSNQVVYANPTMENIVPIKWDLKKSVVALHVFCGNHAKCQEERISMTDIYICG